MNPVTNGGTTSARRRRRSTFRLLSVVIATSGLVPLVAHLLRYAGATRADPIVDKQVEAQRVAAGLAAQGELVSVLAERLDVARLHAAQVNQQLAQARADMAQTDQSLGEQRAKLRAEAVNAYVTDGSAPEIQLLAQGGQEDLGLRRNYLNTVASKARDALNSLGSARSSLDRKRAELASAQDAARAALDAVNSAQHDAAAADAAEQSSLSKVQGELATMVAQEQQRQAAVQTARLQAQLLARVSAPNPGNGGGNASSSSGPSPPVQASSGAAAAVEEAKRQLGKPYGYGGSGPNSFDCSGLTAWAWRAGGKSLPHSASSQYAVTTHIPVSELQPGDLVFYGRSPHHVGIYVGNGQMINALHSGTRVEYDSIYVESDLIGGGRVT